MYVQIGHAEQIYIHWQFRSNHAYLGHTRLNSWPLHQTVIDNGDVGHTDLISLWINYISYMVLNVGQIDQFNTSSQYFHFGMAQSSILIADRQMKKYSLSLSTLGLLGTATVG